MTAMLALGFVGFFLSTLSALAATNTPPKRVLVIDSFGRDVAPFNAAAAAFRTTLARELGKPVDIYEASLDGARFSEPGKEGALADFLRQRFAGRELDLVVPISFPAVSFAARQRQRLFPTTPMLITATDQRQLRPGFVSANTAVVSENVNLVGIIENILQVLPNTKNIVVVLGASPLEEFWLAECRREFQPFIDRVSFTWFNDLSFEEMQKRAAALPPHSAIFFGLLVLDAAGIPYDHDQALKNLRAVANAPIFGYFQSQFGLGIVGGRLYQDHSVGVQAARVAVRILHGEAPGSIPPQFLEPAAPVYDWRELQRWGISESRLPPGSTVQFRQPSFWEEYKWAIILVLALCGLQAVLIDILLRERRQRRLAQLKLEERLRFEQLVSELSSTFIDLPPDKVEAQIIDALGQVARLLRFDIAALSIFTGRGTEARVAFIWRAEGVPEIPSDLTDKDFPWVAHELLAGRDVCIRDLEMLPLAARTDRATYEKYHVRSVYNVRMIAAGELIGVLSLCTAWEKRDMSQELLQGQRLLGEVFANALARKTAEESLQESERNFRRLVETTAAVPWEADIETWVFTYVGPQAVQLLGYPLEQWYEKDFWVSHLYPDDRDFAVNTCLTRSKSAEDFEFEYRMISSSGETVWVHDIVRCECPDGKPARLQGLMLDISDRKRAELELRQQREELAHLTRVSTMGELAASLAHELNQPLTAILSNAQAAQRFLAANPADLEEVREILKDIAEDNTRASEVIRRLHNLVKKGELEVAVLDLAVVARDVVTLVHSDAVLHNVTVSLELDGGLLKVQADKVQLQQVILNLLLNAFQAMKDCPANERRVVVRTELNGGGQMVTVAVRDHGVGLRSEELDKIFQPFYTTRSNGLGMGLTISRSIIEAHGGRLWAENNPDRGATFYFTVPVEGEAGARMSSEKRHDNG